MMVSTGREPLLLTHPIMPTFTRFELVRQFFTFQTGWKTYTCFMDCAEPTTLDKANEVQRNMDYKNSTTLAVIPLY
jgi:hypothetical protein